MLVITITNHTSDYRTTAKRESDLLITSMIADWIGQHDVLLPINQNYGKIRETNKPSIERWTILKRRYECWKTQQFTHKVQISARKMMRTVQLQAWRVQLSN